MPNVCLLCGCRGGNTRDLSFHRFPKDIKRCNQWYRLCHLPQYVSEVASLQSFRLCSSHFDLSQYIDGKLKPDAVPTYRLSDILTMSKTIKRKAAVATIDTLSEPSVSESQVTTSENNVKILVKDSIHYDPINLHLDPTVMIALRDCMAKLIRERPLDPLAFLAASLLKYKKEHVDKASVSET